MAINGFGEVAEKLRRSTALIGAGTHGNGSGVIWSSDGVVVTNAHVARGSRLTVLLWDGRELPATIESRDPGSDLAALRMDAVNLPALIAADSSLVRPGEIAIAIGNPLGFVGALTTGVVHGVGPVRGLGPNAWVQADVRLAPGNSGGPLANARGEVIGINTMVAGRLALAIPSNVVTQFLAAGASDAWMGVTLRPVRVPHRSGAGTFGLLLLEVDSDGPAANASLLPGDILLGTHEARFGSTDDLGRALQGSGPRVLRLEFLRGDYERIRRVTLQLGQHARRSVAA